MEQKENCASKEYLSIIRIVSTCAIILIHVCSTTTANLELYRAKETDNVWLDAIMSLALCSVPSFYMITGALMLDQSREITYSRLLKKYIPRTILAILVFGIPFTVAKLLASKSSVTLVFQKMLRCEGAVYLWYLYVLVFIYLFLPLMRTLVELEKDWLTVGTALLLLILDWISNFAGQRFMLWPFTCVFLGYLLDRLGSGAKPARRRRRILLIVAQLLLAAATVWISIGFPQERGILLDYRSPLVLLSAASFFRLIKAWMIQGEDGKESGTKAKETATDKPQDSTGVLWKLDRLCFGVYLIHPYLLQIIYRGIQWAPTQIRPVLLGILIFWTGFTALSFALSYVLKKIPGIRKIL